MTRTLTGHSDAIPAVAFTGDGRSVISGSLDNSARQWDAESGRQQRAIDLRPAPIATPALPTVTTVAGAGRIALDGRPVSFTIAAPKQEIAWTFNGTAGQQISAAVKVTTIEADIILTGPDGSRVTSRYVGGESFLDSTTLPTTGTYTLSLVPRTNTTGGGTVAVYTFADTTGTITPGGAAIPFALTTPGQNARFTFNTTAGQGISAVVRDSSVSDADIIVYDAAGMRLGSRYVSNEGFFDALALPDPGTYTLVVDPREGALGNGTITAYAVTDTVTAAAPDGTPRPFSLATPGQNARFTFTGTTGQRISAAVTGSTVEGADIILLKVDGTRLVSRYVSNDGFFEPFTLPDTGGYTLVLDPRETDTGAGNVTLYNVADSSGAMTIDGAPVTATLNTPGQRATFSFGGRAGQQIAIEVTSPALNSNEITITAPDGAVVLQRFVGGNDTAEATLPANGTYTLVYDPREGATGNATLTIRTKR